MKYEIKVGSITNAQRGMKALRDKGYSPILTRIENPLPGDGCGYLIKVQSSDEHVIRTLKQADINILGVEVT